jgi:hypothetical protein
MATYPGGIYSPRTKVNRSGVVYDATKETVIFVEDIKKDDDEIVAIEAELGTNAKGAYASVKARLDALRTFTKGWASQKLLRGAGVNVDPSEIIFTQLYGLLCNPLCIKGWQDTAGFTTSFGATGYFTTGWVFGTLGTGYTNGSKAALYSSSSVYVVHAAYGHLLSGYMSVRQITAQTIWFGVFTNPSAPTNTENHFAFKIINADIFASCANGVTQTIEDTGIDASVDTYLMIDSNASSLDFYVNGVLKKSFTTNCPNAVSLYPGYYIINTAAADKILFLKPLSLFAGYKDGY